MEIYSNPLARLGLSPRTLNALAGARLTRVSQVLRRSDEELIMIRNIMRDASKSWMRNSPK